MIRRSGSAALVFAALILTLTGCGAGRAPAIAQLQPPPPSATSKPPTPKRATATPQPPTPTVTPTTAPTATAETSAPSDPTTATRTTATPPGNMPDGWTFYDKSNAGFSFALPAEWRVADLERDNAAQLLGEVEAQVPELRGMFGNAGRSMIGQGLKIVACDCSQAARTAQMPSTMNVIVEQLPAPIAFDAIVQQSVATLEQMPFTVKPVKYTRIDHPGGEAEAIQYRMKLTGPDGKARVITATQYLLVNNRKIVIVTIVASVTNAEAATRTYYKIIQTFRVMSVVGQPM